MKKIISFLTAVILIASFATSFANVFAADGIAGDVNKDKAVNNKDVSVLFKITSGNPPASYDKTACDCNGDGSTNNKDVVLLFKFVSGADVTIVYGKPSSDIDLPIVILEYVPADVFADEETAVAGGFDVPNGSKLNSLYKDSVEFDDNWNIKTPDEFKSVDQYVLRVAKGKYIEEVNVIKAKDAPSVDMIKDMLEHRCEKQKNNMDFQLYDDENKTNEKMIGTGRVEVFGDFIIYAVTLNTEVSLLRARKEIEENPGCTALDVYKAIVSELYE